MEHSYGLQPRKPAGTARMIYEMDFGEDIYNLNYAEDSLDDDELDAAEVGFMHGYLGRWRGF